MAQIESCHLGGAAESALKKDALSRRDQRRSVAVANSDEAADDTDISRFLVRAKVHCRVVVVVKNAGAAQPLEYRRPGREVDGRQVPSSGKARPGVTAGISILGVGVDETVRERH